MMEKQQIQKNVLAGTGYFTVKQRKQQVSFADNRPLALQQRQLCAQMANAPLQCFRIGWIPANPAAFRMYTTATGFTATTNGSGRFHDGHQATVQENNTAQSGGNCAMVMDVPNSHPASDVCGDGILTYDTARVLTPELDHIVERSEGGANDLENARLISKGENNATGTPRPHAPGGAVSLRLYEAVNIADAPTPAAVGKIRAGTLLNDLQADALSRHAIARGAGQVSQISGTILAGIQADTKGVRHGVNLK